MNNLTDLEKNNLSILKDISPECTLFLKRDNDDFPLGTIDKISLYGNGVRNTIKGGTGSGDVDTHFFDSIEDIFIKNGIDISKESKEWCDQYQIALAKHKVDFVKSVKQEAKEFGMEVVRYSFLVMDNEFEFEYPLVEKGDVALYILSRSVGEGKDRDYVKGDYLLTDSEVRIIKYLNANFKKFLLVINSSSPVDLTLVNDVKNILLLGQLGTLVSQTLFDIVFGNSYPSGKLNQTWPMALYNKAKVINPDNTIYEEGIFVGYRYFNTFNEAVQFPFGFGLSYTSFKIDNIHNSNNKEEIDISFDVTNVGSLKGKEVIQLYLKKPSTKLDHPSMELVGFYKTKELKPNETDHGNISFKLSDFPSFDSESSSYILEGGIYNLSIGNSSKNVYDILSINLEEEIIIESVIEDLFPKDIDKLNHKNKNIKLDNCINLYNKDFCATKENHYQKYLVDVPEVINALSNDELIKLVMGNIRGGIQSLVGDNCSKVVGAAGETVVSIPSIKHNLVFTDGPAGIRICKECVSTKKGNFPISKGPIIEAISPYLPKIFARLFDTSRNAKKKSTTFYQYVTAIPSATCLATSFSTEVMKKAGLIIRSEMKEYGTNVWLAPAINIIRHPLCGRNFEYYSEDPFLAAKLVSTLINTVQEEKGLGVTLKHYLCNNQETNRFYSNSVISSRTLREIYFDVFKRVIKESNPFAIMTSYNLINGIHSSENYFTINNLLRCECNFKGLLMTDWIESGLKFNPHAINDTAYASNNIANGNNLNMPGNKKDIKDLKSALKNGKIKREDLLQAGSTIYSSIAKLN